MPDPTCLEFAYTGDVELWTVPAGVTEVQIDIRGGSAGVSTAVSGKGARVVATVTVAAGEELELRVGQERILVLDPDVAGGWPDGGDAGAGNQTGFTYPGAGSSSIKIGGSPIAVAGAGAGNPNGASNGGTPDGEPTTPTYPTGGTGATQSAGGAKGVSSDPFYTDGTDGTFGQGGKGGDYSGIAAQDSGSGGGGGYYGGGGGTYGIIAGPIEIDGPGGGGSSYADPGRCSGVSYSIPLGAPGAYIEICYTPPAFTPTVQLVD